MSSICSNNHHDQVAAILRESGIWDYFIFPDIGWDPKGPRIAALIKAVQLRPQTVLFVDDNTMNRAEASFYVPGLQTAAETFVAGMLADPRLVGKNDTGLARLQQYKVLEKRRSSTAPISSTSPSSGCRKTLSARARSYGRPWPPIMLLPAWSASPTATVTTGMSASFYPTAAAIRIGCSTFASLVAS
jgi:hypothetical protein